MAREVNNELRAQWAATTLAAFPDKSMKLTGDIEEIGEDAIFEVGGDFLCDLFHLCDRVGVDPEQLVETARTHYEAERDGTD